MPKFYDSIPDDIKEWAMAQPVFFTGTAPLRGRHINVSPKGLPSSTFTIFGPNEAGYIDATGSGSETLSHLYEPHNSRITLMFCSFTTLPRILRLFCTGRVLEYTHPSFPSSLARFTGGKPPTGARAIIMLEVWKVQTSCGFGVPIMVGFASEGDEEKGKEGGKKGEIGCGWKDRETLGSWAGKMEGKGEMLGYRENWNRKSLDGLPGLRAAGAKGGVVGYGWRRSWGGGEVVAGVLVWVACAVLFGVAWGMGVVRVEWDGVGGLRR
ncbi:MAG: hypothetical protein Q9227_006155 [Pyrenula ochraceoflavens]